MQRRILSTLLTMCLILGILPPKARAAIENYSVPAEGGNIYIAYEEQNGQIFKWVYDCDDSVISAIIPSDVYKIDERAFQGCDQLNSITIPNNVTRISNYAFSGCSSLESIVIPDSVTTLDGYIFYNCTNLKNITLPKTLDTIWAGTFSNCTALESISFPETVTCIGAGAFSDCSNLKVLNLPNAVDTIYNYAFSGCTSLETITIPKNVTTLEMGAFTGCTNLRQVFVLAEIAEIGLYTFQNCTNLNQIYVPSTVTSIRVDAFKGCANLSDVYYAGSEEQWNQINIATNTSGNLPIINAEKHFNSNPDTDSTPKIIALSFDLDGGTGNFLSRNCHAGDTIILPAEMPQKADYIFTGWLWNSQTYQPGATLTADNHDMTFVAQWAEMRTIEIHLNGGTDIVLNGDKEEHVLAPHSRAVAKGSEFEIPNAIPTKGTMPFLGWTDGTNIYQPGDKFTVESSVQLKAIWSSKDVPAGAHKLTFNLNEGSAPEGWVDTLYFTADEGKSVRLPGNVPVKESFDFAGWLFEGATYQAGGQFPAVNRDVVLTAQWEESFVAQRMAYIQNLTQYSLANARDGDRKIITTGLYNLMFKAQYRPNKTTILGDNMVFDGNSMASWPIQNDNAYGYSVTDDVLGFIPFAEGGAGCMSYALFATAYIYGTSGTQRCCTDRTATGIRNFVRQYADPGEQLRFTGNGVHSIVFLGESRDGEGLYCLSYHGGRPDTSSTANDLRVEYRSYASLASRARSSFTVRDANNGSCYSTPNTVTPVSSIRESADITKKIIRIACPVEATIRLNNEILDSRTPSTTSFGNVQHLEDEIVFTLDYNFNYDLEITGTGFGVMTLALEYYADETLVDTRTICNLPIEPDTEIQSSKFDPFASFVLYVNPATIEESTWGVGINETIYAPNDDFSSMNNDLEGGDNSTSTPPSIPSTSTNSSVTSPPKFPITLPTSIGGRVTASIASASKGTLITLTATTDPGYELVSLTVTDSKGNELKLTDKGDGKYTFTMPDGNVTVDAVFQPIPIQEEPQTPWINPFSDVDRDTWYYGAVEFVSVNGLMNGISSTLFTPDANLTRAQLAQILYNKEGKPAVSGNSTFVDVDPDTWYSDAVTWAAANGIIGGYGDGRFGPNDNITREQLAVMLWRYAGSSAATDKELHFTDTDQASGYALEAIRWAAENGVLNGYGDGRLGPQGHATRAQVAQMLKNQLER